MEMWSAMFCFRKQCRFGNADKMRVQDCNRLVHRRWPRGSRPSSHARLKRLESADVNCVFEICGLGKASQLSQRPDRDRQIIRSLVSRFPLVCIRPLSNLSWSRFLISRVFHQTSPLPYKGLRVLGCRVRRRSLPLAGCGLGRVHRR